MEPWSWMQWQVTTACAVVVAMPFLAPSANVVKLVEKLDIGEYNLMASDLWMPCWRALHPLWLLAYRCLAAAVLSWLLYRTCLQYGSFAFYFYTTWTLVLVIVYFMIAVMISAHGCWIYNSRGQIVERSEDVNKDLKILQSQKEQENNGEKAGILGYGMQIIYQTCAGAVVLTDIVFWGVLLPFLSDDQYSLNMMMYCLHSLNVMFLLLDTVLNSLPFPWFRVTYFLLWGCIYVVFQWVLHACGHTRWPYPFLDVSAPWAPVWYISMAMVHLPCYGLYWLLVKAKLSFFF